MTNESDQSASAARPSLAVGLRKLTFSLGALVLLWLFFAVGMPMFFGARHKDGNLEPSTVRRAPLTEMMKERDERANALQTRVDQLEARLKTLEDVVTAAPRTESTPASDARIDALQAKLDALQQQPPGTPVHADDTRLTHLENALGKQEEQVGSLKEQVNDLRLNNARQLAALTSFHALKESISRGEPYAARLAQLTQAADGNAAAQEQLSILQPYADKGVATLSVLRTQFDSIAPQALMAGSQEGTLASNLHKLVRIRKVGEQPGNDDEAVIARAETRLTDGELDAAIKELAQLSPPAVAVFAPWAGKAQEVVRVRNALDALQLSLAQDDKTVPVMPPAPAPPPMPAPAPEPTPEPVPDPATGVPSE